MPVPASDVITWLGSLGGWDTSQETGCPFCMGPYVPEEPDTLAVVTMTPGAGFQLEGAADMCGFQARVRSGQSGDGSTGAQEAAESLAYALDGLIFGASFPAVLASGRVLVMAHRPGGMPSPLPQAPGDMDRMTYVCSYLIEVSN